MDSSRRSERAYRFHKFIELLLFLFGGQQEEGEVLSGGIVWRENERGWEVRFWMMVKDGERGARNAGWILNFWV